MYRVSPWEEPWELVAATKNRQAARLSIELLLARSRVDETRSTIGGGGREMDHPVSST